MKTSITQGWLLAAAALCGLELGNRATAQDYYYDPSTIEVLAPAPLPPVVDAQRLRRSLAPNIDHAVRQAQSSSIPNFDNFDNLSNASIPTPTASGNQASNLYNQFLASSSSWWSQLPPMMLDQFDGNNQSVIIRDTTSYSFYAQGTLIAGAAGSANAAYAFEADGVGGPNDFFTTGTGVDTNGDGFADRFAISEPLPPNEVPTNPNPGFVYDGGTVIYTDDQSRTTAANVPPAVYANGDAWLAQYSFSSATTISLPAVGGAAVRRVKLAENNSPIPRDRFYLDYRFFNDVRGGAGDVNRYSVGVEKTFNEGRGSLEARIPFAATLDSVQSTEGALARDFELGNITFMLKQALLRTDYWLLTSGVGWAIPTGDNSRVIRPNVGEIMRLENDSYHILPFAAALWTPNETHWVQSFLQLDLDANGNEVFANSSGGVLPSIGRVNDSTWLMIDTSAGKWIGESNGLIAKTGIFGEVHYNTTLNNADVVSGNGITVTDLANRRDYLSTTGGMHFVTSRRWLMTVGMTIPIRSGDDRPIDYEVAALINGFFY